MVVTKPATERPRLPSVGRLGLVDPTAAERLTQLGWYDRDDPEYVDRLWSLSRAPDPDAALLALVRLSENPDSGWDELNAALLTERGLRGRLFAVLGSSLALGDHLAASPQSWKLLRGKAHLPSREQLLATFTECVDEFHDESSAAPGSVQSRLRNLYRDQLLVLAALDVAATVEDEPVLPFTLVAAQLSDMADAALAAALRVAEFSVCGDRTPPRLAVMAVGDQALEMRLRIRNGGAVRRVVDGVAARAQLVEARHIGGHVAVGRCDNRRRPTHDMVAAEQHAAIGQSETKVVRGMAGGVHRLDSQRPQDDRIAIV